MNLIRGYRLSSKGSIASCLLFLLLLITPRAVASELTFSGFATLAATYAEHDQLLFRTTMLNRPRDNLSFTTDSVLGFQLNYEVTNDLDIVAQVVIQDRGDTEWKNYVEKAFIRYRFDRHWSLRAGRMHTNLFLLSEYRPVSYAQSWARPPVAFYSSTSVAAVMDGIQIKYATDIGEGYARFGLGYGKSSPSLSDGGQPYSVDFDNLITLSAEYQTDYWLFKGTVAGSQLNNFVLDGFNEFFAGVESIPEAIYPGIIDIREGYRTDNKDAWYYAVGTKYDDSEWQLQAEIGALDANWLSFPDLKFGYLSIGKYLGDFMPYYVISAARPIENTPVFEAPALPPVFPQDVIELVNLAALIATQSVANVAVDQNTHSFGVRWDFAPDWALKAQFDHIRVNYPGGGLYGFDSINSFSYPTNLNVLHLGLSTVF